MSIKPLDMQVSVSKTVEISGQYDRESQKGARDSQIFTSELKKQQNEQNEVVIKSNKDEMLNNNFDAKEKGNNSYTSNNKKKTRNKKKKNNNVGTKNKIDIRI